MEINKSVKYLLIKPKDLYSEAQGYVRREVWQRAPVIIMLKWIFGRKSVSRMYCVFVGVESPVMSRIDSFFNINSLLSWLLNALLYPQPERLYFLSQF